MAHQWLIDEYENKMVNAGIPRAKAHMLARMAAELEENETLWNRIKNEGFDGFCRWVEVNFKNFYEDVKSALRAAWVFLTSWL